MGHIELQWLAGETSLKAALQDLFHCSGQLLKKHYSSKQLILRVRERDLLKVPLDVANHLKINPVFNGPVPSIITETEDYIALHKPPGIHCHPLCYSDKNTLLNFLALKAKWAGLNVNEENYDRGLLYRLDFETSGVVMIAKTKAFFEKIRNVFENEMKEKIYLALVEGDFNHDGEWTHYFRPTGPKGSKQVLSDVKIEGSLPGTLIVKKLKFKNNLSLLEVSLKSGLRHQIRAQLAHLGFPILGDEFYGGAKAPRLYLHAYRYQGKWGHVMDRDVENFYELV